MKEKNTKKNMKTKRKKGFFSISAVAKMFSVHQQTVRLYEKQGLITPKRSSGNTRLFSENDVDRLEEIIYLTHELGINLAGVEMILKLKKQINKMQQEMNKIFEKTQEQLQQQAHETKQNVQTSAQRLLQIKKESTPTDIHHETEQFSIVPDEHVEPESEDIWEIEYEE